MGLTTNTKQRAERSDASWRIKTTTNASIWGQGESRKLKDSMKQEPG